MGEVSTSTTRPEESGPSATAAASPAAEAPVDTPPLWTPADEEVFGRAVRSRPPDAVDGWTAPARLLHFFLASPRAIVARCGMVVAVVALLLGLPGLAGHSDWGNLGRVALYHGWTLALLLLVFSRVRAIPAHRVLSFALLGASIGALAVYYLAGPLTDLFDPQAPSVWISPPLEEAVKLGLVAVVLVAASRGLRHPGVVDFLIVGYAVGAGFSFHEDALWGRVTTSGFEGSWGIAFPSFFQPEGLFLVAHAGWTALAGAGLGLIVLHWRRPVFAVAGGVLMIVAVADHMAINDRDGSFDWVIDVLYDHKLPGWMLIAALAIAAVLDLRLLRAMELRDHLLTGETRPGRGRSTRAGARRFRRARNGVYFARHRDRSLWPAPPRAATRAVLTSLGRLAGALGRSGGPQAVRGWDADPDDPARARWYGPDGWTPYVAATTGVDLAPPPGRRHAVGITRADPSPGWAKMLVFFASVVVAAVIIRLLTVPEDGPGGIQFAPHSGGRQPDPVGPRLASLADAPNGPGPWGWGGAGAGAGAGAGGGGSGPGTNPGPGDGPTGEPPPLPPDFFDDFGPGSDGPPEDSEDNEEEEECP